MSDVATDTLTEAPSAPAKSPAERELVALKPGDVMTQRQSYQAMNAYIPTGVSVENLTDPKLWVNVASKLLPGAEIRCVAEDMSYRALVFVRYKNGHELNIELLEAKEFKSAGADAMPSSKYTVDFINNRFKWGIKGPDGEWIKKEIANEAQAYKERDEHIRAMRS